MLDGFAFGGDVVASLGINIKHIRVILLGFTALIAADIVANAGAIRFIDLVIPHLCRMHRHLIRIAAPFGGILLLCATMIDAYYRPLSYGERQHVHIAQT